MFVGSRPLSTNYEPFRQTVFKCRSVRRLLDRLNGRLAIQPIKPCKYAGTGTNYLGKRCLESRGTALAHQRQPGSARRIGPKCLVQDHHRSSLSRRRSNWQRRCESAWTCPCQSPHPPALVSQLLRQRSQTASCTLSCVVSLNDAHDERSLSLRICLVLEALITALQQGDILRLSLVGEENAACEAKSHVRSGVRFYYSECQPSTS